MHQSSTWLAMLATVLASGSVGCSLGDGQAAESEAALEDRILAKGDGVVLDMIGPSVVVRSASPIEGGKVDYLLVNTASGISTTLAAEVDPATYRFDFARIEWPRHIRGAERGVLRGYRATGADSTEITCTEIDGVTHEIRTLGHADAFFAEVACKVVDGQLVAWSEHSANNVADATATLTFRTPTNRIANIKATRAGLFTRSEDGHVAYATASAVYTADAEGARPLALAQEFRAYSLQYAGAELFVVGRGKSDGQALLYRFVDGALRKIADDPVKSMEPTDDGRAVVTISPAGVLRRVDVRTNEVTPFGVDEAHHSDWQALSAEGATALPLVRGRVTLADGAIAFTTNDASSGLNILEPGGSRARAFPDFKGSIAVGDDARAHFLMREEATAKTPARAWIVDAATHSRKLVDDRDGDLAELGFSEDGSYVYAFRTLEAVPPVQDPPALHTTLGLFQVATGARQEVELGASSRRSFLAARRPFYFTVERRDGLLDAIRIDPATGRKELVPSGEVSPRFVSPDGLLVYVDRTGSGDLRARQLP